MKKSINKKMYNTETAEEVAKFWNGLGSNDFRNLSETLYLTKNGNWFLHGSGGANSKYAIHIGNMSRGNETIIPLSIDETIEWCEMRNEEEVIETYFSSHIAEA